MYVKVTTSGPRRYVQLLESFRDSNGRVKKRTVATLGRLDHLRDDLDCVIDGLLKVAGRETSNSSSAPIGAASLSFESARALGNVWVLTQLWKDIGFSNLRKVFRRTKHTIDVEALIRLMVFNRLCDPDSKLGVLRWAQTVALPDVQLEAVSHQHLLRAMDALMDHQAAVDSVVADSLRPLMNSDLSLAFYDMTTIRAAGLSELEGDVRHYGMAKEGLIARQFMLGVVQTAEGLPIYHEVFDGNTAEAKTLLPILKVVLERFPQLKRLVLVADRGLLSLDNLEELRKIKLPNGHGLEFILAVPGRRYNEFVQLLEPLQQRFTEASTEVTAEVPWNGLRLVVAHDPKTAFEQRQKRQSKMDELQALANAWVGKLDEQDQGAKKRGRKLSDSGAKARFYHEVKEHHLGNIIKVDLKGELFNYRVDEQALKLAQLMDGKLLVVSNVADLKPEEIMTRYKSLADIERGFKVLKSELEIGPVYHRLPERIRAHACICFMALIVHRIMRQRLKEGEAGISPERALQTLKRIQHHRVSINGSDPMSGVGTISPEDAKVFKALKVNLPSQINPVTLL
jgi:transposase